MKLAAMTLALWGFLSATSYARPCDAVQKSSGEFAVGKPFDGVVIAVLDAKTIRMIPDKRDAIPQNWCDVDLRMFSAEHLTASSASAQRNFLEDFVQHRGVVCMPQPANRSHVNGQTVVTIWNGDRISASCDVSYPLGELQQRTAKARR
jgi:hypothetical protein